MPYEDGWSATVNGQEAVIEKVNVGFMAVRVPAGQTSEIRFQYETPGLKIGIVISIAALLLFIGYLLLCRRLGKHSPTPPVSKRRTYRIASRSGGSYAQALPSLGENSAYQPGSLPAPGDKQSETPVSSKAGAALRPMMKLTLPRLTAGEAAQFPDKGQPPQGGAFPPSKQ